MESLSRSLSFELPHELHWDKYAQQILESSKAVVPAATPTAPNTNGTPAAATTSSDILQKIGATLLNSIQLKKFLKTDNSPVVVSTTGAHDMELMDLPLNHVAIDSTGFDAMDELQKQLEYDKFMNEVWIGIVLTLVLISMVFCICSCFLYHQFRTWKRNYRSTVAQAQTPDSEAAKLHPDAEDPVPEYTLVSGLPSYEAALELLHKTPQSCLIVCPSVFSAFNKHEKSVSDLADWPQQQSHLHQHQQQQQQQQHQHIVELTTPLLTTPTTPTLKTLAALPTYAEANTVQLPNDTLTAISEKQEKSPATATPATAAATTTPSATAAATATELSLATSHRDEMLLLTHKN